MFSRIASIALLALLADITSRSSTAFITYAVLLAFRTVPARIVFSIVYNVFFLAILEFPSSTFVWLLSRWYRCRVVFLALLSFLAVLSTFPRLRRYCFLALLCLCVVVFSSYRALAVL